MDITFLAWFAVENSAIINVKLNCARVDWRPKPAPPKDVVADSLKFAPVYFFDGKAQENCVPDNATADNNGVCRSDWHDPMPTYVEYSHCDGYEVYTFWLWYGWQKGCFAGSGGRHDNEWEHVSVFVENGQAQRVIYYQHTEHYTRTRGTFGLSGERPHVYIGKTAHGSYHAPCDGVCDFHELFRGCLGTIVKEDADIGTISATLVLVSTTCK
ncbi:hypothetical protein ACA910_009857 [Epithemia clementina (nom. ined.)]